MDTTNLPTNSSAALEVHNTDDIRRAICAFLQKPDLARCARVSEKWLETSSERIWRKVNLVQFMKLLEPAQAARGLTSTLSRSAAYYLPAVRYINVPHGNFDSNLSSAHFISIHYPQVFEMEGENWSVDFAHRTIHRRRELENPRKNTCIDQDRVMSDFRIEDRWVVEIKDFEHRIPKKRIDTSPPRRGVIPLSHIFAYNTDGSKHASPNEDYATLITSIHWMTTDDPEDRSDWWEAIPSMAHLDNLTYSACLNDGTTLERFEYLVSSRFITVLNIEDEDRASITKMMDIITIAWKHVSAREPPKPLELKWSVLRVDREGVRSLNHAATEMNDRWTRGLTGGSETEVSSTGPLLRCAFEYDIEDEVFDLSGKRRRAVMNRLRKGMRLLNSLSKDIVVTLDEYDY